MVSCTGCASRTTITLNGTDAIVRDTSFCAGTIGFDSLYLVPIANNPVFSWDSAGVTGFSTSQNPVIPIPSVTTTYTITVTDTSTNCTVVKMETINITPPPTPQITPPFAICAGGTAVITAGGGVGYSWSTGDITSSISVTPITTATYYVTVTNAAGCISTDSTTITVNSPLPVVATAIPPSICVGGSSMLSVAAVAGGQYIWTQSGTGTMTGATTNTPSVTPNGTETYTVVVTDANGCITFGLDTVTVNPNPIITVSSNPSTLTVCQDSSAILTASGAGAGGSYSWNGPGLSSTTTDTTTATPPSSNTSYTVIGTTINGCIDSAKVIIIIAPPLTVTVDSANICSGTCAQLNATASGGGVNFNWAPDPTLSSLTVSNPTACPFVTTTYSVTASNSSNCPSATGSGTIIVHPIPPILVGTIPPLVGTDTTILAGDTLVLTANGGGTTYNWWSESGFSCSNCPQISASPLVTTLYFVTTIDQFGCRNTDSILVKVDDVLTLYIPSAFTPDDKNSNNTMFYAYGIGIHTFEFYVFDRWGNKMFESTSPYVGWDGTFKGQKVQEDVYVYLAKARSITGKSITKTGAVTVVK